MSFFDKDNLIFGLVSGILAPLIGFGVLQGIFWVLSEFLNSNYGDWRLRTITLIAICFSLIPFNYHKNRRNENSMRGVMLPTIIYAITWVVVYREYIFGE